MSVMGVNSRDKPFSSLVLRGRLESWLSSNVDPWSCIGKTLGRGLFFTERVPAK